MKNMTSIITDFGKLNIIRPLLTFEKKDLKIVVKANDINWVEDQQIITSTSKEQGKIYLNKFIHNDFKLLIEQYARLKLQIDKILLINIMQHVVFNNTNL